MPTFALNFSRPGLPADIVAETAYLDALESPMPTEGQHAGFHH
jgi:glutamate decarboxylase